MVKRRTTVGVALVGALAVGALSAEASYADPSPQPGDVVSVGSDIQQNAFNFLADGYGALPGYNTAGNKNRFINFDSSGDANGRSAYIDPSSVNAYPGNLDGEGSNEQYIRLGDAFKVLNPTISLRAGAPLVVRPSGGNGGLTALLQDGSAHWIDVGRSPNLPSAAQQATAQTNLGGPLHTIQVGLDKDLIATSADDPATAGTNESTNAPASLSAEQILKIYRTTGITWGELLGAAAKPGTADEVIVPLILPDSAGMLNVFLNGLRAANNGNPVTKASLRSDLRTVQQNDPTAITGLPLALRKNAIVPFPRGRYKLLGAGYYVNPASANSYSQLPAQPRQALSTAGIALIGLNDDAPSAADGKAAFGWTFAYNAVFRDSDLDDETPFQPGGTLNWVRTLFYNPGGPAPFVDTEAGHALLEAAGITPAYEDKGTE